MKLILKNEYKIILLCLFFLVIGFILFVPGLFSIDEVTYFLMSHSLVKDHSFAIWNGFDEFNTTYFGIFEPVYYKKEMYGKYPPLYPVISYPFYSLFGLRGLFYINIISFIITIFILYKFTDLLFNNHHLSFLVCCVYSFCTFTFEYALGLWPHMLSVCLVISSYYLFEISSKQIDKITTSLFLFLSGFLISLSIGIRLQNIISVGIISLTILIFSKEKPISLAAFFIGNFPIFFIICYINYYRFGSIDPFSYGHYSGKNIKFFLDYPELLLLFAFFFLFFYLAFRFREIILKTSKSFLKPILGTLSILLLVILLADPKWTFFNFLKNIYANLVDLSVYFSKQSVSGQRADIVYFGHIKKALLQSCPFLILSFISPWIMKKESCEVRKIFLLSAAFFIQLMFTSSFFFHGGFAFNVRYALELLPFAVILCCYTIKDIKISKSQIVLVVILSIPFIIQNRFYSNKLFWKQLSITYLPLLLTIILFLFFILKGIFKNNIVKYFFSLILLMSFAYGTVMGFTEDLFGSRNIRKEHYNMTEELNKKTSNDSLIIMEVDKTVGIIAIKGVKKVRIASKGKHYADLINFYLEKQIPVYLISNNEDYLLIKKDYSNYNIKNIPSEHFLLYEILGVKKSM